LFSSAMVSASDAPLLGWGVGGVALAAKKNCEGRRLLTERPALGAEWFGF
jgi:hypothetical protein